MNLCAKHKEDDESPIAFLFHMTKGDGFCDKHGRFCFDSDNLKEYCYECAVDKNICQVCGKSLEAK